MFLLTCFILFGGWSLYEVTSCLVAWSHVPSGGCLCLWSHVPSRWVHGGLCARGSLSKGSLSGKGGLCVGGLCARGLCAGVSVLGGLCAWGSLSGRGSLSRKVSVWKTPMTEKPPLSMVKSRRYASYRNAFFSFLYFPIIDFLSFKMALIQ